VEKGSSISPIHHECGYEIHRGEGETLFVDRRTWPLGYVMVILCGVAVVMIVLGVLVLLGEADDLSNVPAVVVFGVAAVLVLILAAMWRTYNHRRDLPLSEVADGMVLDSNAGVLRGRNGEVLARLDSVRAVVRVDWWWTRGLMRLVVLTWPAGRRVVFRSASRKKVRAVIRTLHDLGIGKPHD